MKLFDRIFGPHTPPSVDASKKIFGILHEQTENPVDPLAQQGRFQVRAAEKPQEKIKTTDDLLVEFKKKFPNGASSNGLSAFFHEVYDSGRVDSDTWGKDYAEVYDGLFKLFILYQLEDNGLNAYRAKQLSTQTPVEEQTTPLEVSVEKKEEETSIKVGMFSLASEGHPEHNEDKAFANITTRSFGVFDGMGGVDGGEKAASLACDFVRDQSAYLEVDDTVLQAKENLEYCMHEANTIVFTDPYQENKKPEHRMGTTGCLARIVEDENKEKKLVVASVADSRTYVFRSTGELECITLDNGVGEEGVGGDFTSKAEKMALQKKFSNAVSTDGFSDFEKFKWNRRNVVGGALGIFQTTTFGMYETTINDGDVVLLTSDGIHDNLTEDEIKKYIQNALASGSSPEMISMQLAQKAQERSREADPNDPGEAHFRAKPDDMTAVVVFVGEKKQGDGAQAQSDPFETTQQMPIPALTPEQEQEKKEILDQIQSIQSFEDLREAREEILNQVAGFIIDRIGEDFPNLLEPHKELVAQIQEHGASKVMPDIGIPRMFRTDIIAFFVKFLGRTGLAQSQQEQRSKLFRIFYDSIDSSEVLEARKAVIKKHIQLCIAQGDRLESPLDISQSYDSLYLYETSFLSLIKSEELVKQWPSVDQEQRIQEHIADLSNNGDIVPGISYLLSCALTKKGCIDLVKKEFSQKSSFSEEKINKLIAFIQNLDESENREAVDTKESKEKRTKELKNLALKYAQARDEGRSADMETIDRSIGFGEKGEFMEFVNQIKSTTLEDNNFLNNLLDPETPEAITEEKLREDLAHARGIFAEQIRKHKQELRDKKSKLRKLWEQLGTTEKQIPEAEKSQNYKLVEDLYNTRKKQLAEYLLSQSEQESHIFNQKTNAWEDKIVTKGQKIFNQSEKEFDLLHKQTIESMSPVEVGIAKKTLHAWANLKPWKRVAISSAFITFAGASLGTVGFSAILATFGIRATRGIIGATVAQGVGKYVDGIQKKKLEDEKMEKMQEYMNTVDINNFLEKEKEMAEVFRNQKNQEKRNLLKKAGWMALAGGVANVGLSYGVGSMNTFGSPKTGAIDTLKGGKPSTVDGIQRPKIGIEKNDSVPPPVKHDPVGIDLSEKGYIQTIKELQSKILSDFDEDPSKMSPEVKDIVGSRPEDLAIKLKLWKPGEGASAYGLKGEQLVYDSQTNSISIKHIDGSSDALTKGDEVIGYKGEYLAPKVEPALPNNLGSAEFVPPVVDGKTGSIAHVFNMAQDQKMYEVVHGSKHTLYFKNLPIASGESLEKYGILTGNVPLDEKYIFDTSESARAVRLNYQEVMYRENIALVQSNGGSTFSSMVVRTSPEEFFSLVTKDDTIDLLYYGKKISSASIPDINSKGYQSFVLDDSLKGEGLLGMGSKYTPILKSFIEKAPSPEKLGLKK